MKVGSCAEIPPQKKNDFHWAVEIWPDFILKSPKLGAHAPSEGEEGTMHDINVKVYYTNEPNTLSMSDHMTKTEKHQAVRRYRDILKKG